MPEPDVVLGWLIPAAVVFGVTAVVVVALVLVVRHLRRSPRARAAAEAARRKAGGALVRLDDAVDELDLEVGLSGALYQGTAPSTLRRARMSAQHVRDDAFAHFAALSDAALLPADVRRGAARIESRATTAIAAITQARAEHGRWVAGNVSAGDQVAAARRRLADVRETMGDPDALLMQLSARFDASEWRDAAAAAADARAAADEAEQRLDGAAASAADPSRSALPELAAAERALRRAQSDARTLEETHRVVTQASEALPGEFDAAHQALRQAVATRQHLTAAAADRLGNEIRQVEASIAALRVDAGRRPTATVDGIARLRDRLDLALGDARTAQQRVRGARTALPGTLAAARSAIAHAEASVAHAHIGADARVRLVLAQRELAAARTSAEPVAALDAARRAIRAAEDAQALADYDRTTAR